MIRQPIKQSNSIILGVVSIVLAIVGYTALSWRQHAANPDDKSIPTWSQMYKGFQQSATPQKRSGEVWLKVDAKATGARLGISLGVGVGFGLLLGILGCLSTVKAFLSPILSFASQIPPTAIIAVFFAFVPIMATISPMTEEYNLYIAIVCFGVVPSMAQGIHLSIRDVPDQLIFKAYTLGASHLEVIYSVIFRQIFPRIIDIILSLFGPTMVYLIAAEMLCAGEGFGYRIRLQSRLVNMDVVFPYIIILSAFGFSVKIALTRMQLWLCPWFTRET